MSAVPRRPSPICNAPTQIAIGAIRSSVRRSPSMIGPHAEVVGRVQRARFGSGDDLGALRLDHAGLGRGGGDFLGKHQNMIEPVSVHCHSTNPESSGDVDVGCVLDDQLRRAAELGRIDTDGAVASGHAAAYRAMKFVPTRFLSVGEWTLRPWRGECGADQALDVQRRNFCLRIETQHDTAAARQSAAPGA
jgi:hypothetical protein